MNGAGATWTLSLLNLRVQSNQKNGSASLEFRRLEFGVIKTKTRMEVTRKPGRLITTIFMLIFYFGLRKAGLIMWRRNFIGNLAIAPHRTRFYSIGGASTPMENIVISALVSIRPEAMRYGKTALLYQGKLMHSVKLQMCRE